MVLKEKSCYPYINQLHFYNEPWRLHSEKAEVTIRLEIYDFRPDK